MYQAASDAFYTEGKSWDNEVSKSTSLKYHTENLELYLAARATLS